MSDAQPTSVEQPAPDALDPLRELCITVLYSGYAPFASGSWGSLVSVLLFAGAWAPLSGVLGRWFDAVVIIPGIAVACVLSVVWGRWALAKFASGDPKPFVLDEFAGQWIALLLLPPIAFGGWAGFAAVMFGQLFWFRVFDVLKVPPAAQLERLPAGWGVLCDDLAAGVYANIVGQLMWRLTPLASMLGLSTAAGS